jgi:hypothetical protein
VVSTESLDDYTTTLSSLVRAAIASISILPLNVLGAGIVRTEESERSERTRTDSEDVSRGDEAERPPRTPTEASLVSVANIAERYLDLSNHLEAELDGIRLAALMGGHWLAATALTVAAKETTIAAPSAPGRASLTRILMANVPRSDEFARLVEDSEGPLGPFFLFQVLSHDVPEIGLGLRGEPSVQGGAVDKLDDAVTHVTKGLVLSANSIAASAAASGFLAPLLHDAAISFAHHEFLADIPGVQTALGRIQKLALNVVGHAIELARKLIGDEDFDQIEHWLHDHVTKLIEDAEMSTAKRALQTEDLEARCTELLNSLASSEASRRLSFLDAVSADYDHWSKYGTKGMRLLAYLPVAALGSTAVPIIALAAVALLAYEVWTAWDHFDWPNYWPLYHHSIGIAARVGIVTRLDAPQK